MKTITVNASKSYDVIIGDGLISSLPTLLKNAKIDGKLAIVTDKTVNSLYGDKLISALCGYDYALYVSDGGETCKSGAEFLSILEFLRKTSLRALTS